MHPDWHKYGLLHQKKQRRKLGQFMVEGVRLCREVISSGYPITIAFFDETFRDSEVWSEFQEAILRRATPFRFLKPANFKKLANTQTPQGVLFILPIAPPANIAEEAKNWRTVILLENLQDPGNVGTLIRTADWFGMDAVLLSPECVDLYNPKTIRSSMGSVFHLPVIQIEDTVSTLMLLKKSGFSIVAATTEAESNIDLKPENPVVVILGSEAEGISKPIEKMADFSYSITGRGQAESLNVAVAGGIIMEKLSRSIPLF